MRWCAPGRERPFAEFLRLLAGAEWPTPPDGFRLLTPARPMRLVLRGPWPGGGEVVVKWQRPDALADRVSRRLRGGKGAREGNVLLALTAADVPVPPPIAFSDEGVDVLVTEALDDLEPLPPATGGEALRAVARLLARAHEAGLEHRDLHAGNLAWRRGAPLFVDLGRARIARPPTGAALVEALARAREGLLAGARRTQRLRALRAYLAEREEGRADTLARAVEQAALRLRRRYRRGRDRRARRTGRHFEQFSSDTVARGARLRDTTDPDVRAAAARWLAAPPRDAVPLKAGGAVLRVGDVVLKYYDAVAAGRLPRPLRDFRRACALMNRGLAVPPPHVAAAREDGSGVYAAAYVEAPNLHACVARGDVDADLLRRLGRALRLLHDAEVTHRDLKAPNLLVTGADFPVADLEGVRVRHRPVSWSRRAHDLMRLDASLDLPPGMRAHVLRGYHDVLPRPPVSFDAFAARVARLAARKRGPSGRAR